MTVKKSAAWTRKIGLGRGCVVGGEECNVWVRTAAPVAAPRTVTRSVYRPSARGGRGASPSEPSCDEASGSPAAGAGASVVTSSIRP